MGDVQEETCITAPATSSGCFRGCAQTHGAVALRIQMCYSRLEFGNGMNRRRAPACAACRVCAVCRQSPIPPRPCGASVRWRGAGGPEASVSEFYLNERPYTAMFQECRTVYTTDKTSNKWKRCRVSSDHRRRRAAGARTKTDKWNTWVFGGERGSA
jgi:hypothetical protein